MICSIVWAALYPILWVNGRFPHNRRRNGRFPFTGCLCFLGEKRPL
ncbi:MAG: hypothetical protein R3C62_10715 [Chloroflexota bacterium]